jgi:uncharacterized protein involved in exopolysaccharide biosynthesis
VSLEKTKSDKIDALFKGTEATIEYLLRWKRIILILAFVGGILGFCFAKFSDPSYKSHLTFSLEEGAEGGSMGGIAGIAAQFGIVAGGNGSGVFAGNNITEILKSRRMIERVLLSVDTFENNQPSTLIDYYLHINQPEKKQLASFPVSQINSGNNNFTHLQDSILYKTYFDIVDKDIKASRPDLELDIYELNFTSPNEKFTKVFTDRILDETKKFYTELRTKKNQETVDVLEQRVASLKGSLNNSIGEKALTQDANLNMALSAPQVPIQKQMVNMQVYGKAYEELYKNLELARYQLLENTPLLQVIDAADYPMEKIKASKIKYSFFSALIFGLLTIGILLLIRTTRLKRYK